MINNIRALFIVGQLHPRNQPFGRSGWDSHWDSPAPPNPPPWPPRAARLLTISHGAQGRGRSTSCVPGCPDMTNCLLLPLVHLGSHQPRCSYMLKHIHACSHMFIQVHPFSSMFILFPQKMEGQSIARTGSFQRRSCRQGPVDMSLGS